jgi:hypothetical protein
MLGCFVSSSCLCILACCAFLFLISFLYHAQTWHHANICIYLCILLTETPENKPIEPTKTIEPEPGVEFIVEPEENQGKQLSMISFSPLKLI